MSAAAIGGAFYSYRVEFSPVFLLVVRKIIPILATVWLLSSTAGIAATGLEGSFQGLQDIANKFLMMQSLQLRNTAGEQAFKTGDYATALKEWQEGLRLARQATIKEFVGAFLSNIGSVYLSLGQYTRALEHYQEALPIFRALHYRGNEANVLANIGSIHTNLGQYAEALDYYRQALGIHREINSRCKDYERPAAIPDAFQGGGQALTDLLNRLPQVSECYRDTLAAELGGGSRRGEAMDLANIGVVYENLGQHAKAVAYYQQALVIHREINDRHAEGVDLTNIGSTYKNIGQFEKALSYYRQALTLHRNLNHQEGVGAVLTNIGLVYWEKGQYQPALEHHQQALAIHRKIGDQRGEGNSLINIGVAYQGLSKHDQALTAFRDAVAVLEKIDAPASLWLAQRGLASAQAHLSRYDKALRHYQQALSTVEGLRSGLEAKAHRLSFLGDRLFAYDEFINLLQGLHNRWPDRGYDRQALEVFELKQGRVFLEEIGQSGARRFAGLPPQVVQRELALDQQLAAVRALLDDQRTKPGDQQNQASIQQLGARLQALKAERQALETEIKEQYPDYYALKYPTPVTLNELQTQVLQPGEIMLIYGVMEDSTALWTVGREKFQMFTLPVGERGLQEQVNAIRHLLGARPEEGSGEQAIILRGVTLRWSETKLNGLTEQTHKLFKQLLPESVRGLLKGKRLVYIVPTGPLYTLPFEMLVQPGKEQPHYLIEDYPIAYLSSASLLRTLREAETRKQATARYPFLAFADPVYEKASEKKAESDSMWGGVLPELPETAEEAKEIAMLFESPTESDPLQLREQAARSKVLEFNEQQRLDDYRYLLFATHGILPGEIDRITQPALVLTHPEKDGGDGFLTMADVFALELNADLVSLSACNTGMGERVRGEGVLGLSRAFMYAGTPTVAMTLWSVESLSAKELSVGMFRHLRETSQPAEALRRIKLEMLRGEMGEAYRHPRYWAPLVVFGDAGS